MPSHSFLCFKSFTSLAVLLLLFLTHARSAEAKLLTPVVTMRPAHVALPPTLEVNSSDVSSVHIRNTFNFYLGGPGTPAIKFRKTSNQASPSSPAVSPEISSADPPPTTIAWIPKSTGDKPEFSVIGGLDLGRNLYVARVRNVGVTLPGFISDGQTTIYYPFRGRQLTSTDYEVLIAPPGALSWVEVERRKIPENAIQGGQETNGNPLYIARITYEKAVIVGYADSNGMAQLSYGGHTLTYMSYEILVLNLYGKALMPEYKLLTIPNPPTTTDFY